MLALLAAFVVQIEPAQWSAITVWIVFMQAPRLNYSKIIWWVFGTVTGALVAVMLIALFNQAPDLLLGALAVWLAVCAAAGALVRSYQAYGAVLAGYTCAIVSMSALEKPEAVFQLAVTRVSCIFIGMAAAILVMGLLMRPHRHWPETLHHLGEFLKITFREVAHALHPPSGATPLGWAHMVGRLSTLEHTLDVTLAETPESRLRAGQARSLVATLSCLLAKAQSLEMHRKHAGAWASDGALFARAAARLEQFAMTARPEEAEAHVAEAIDALAELRLAAQTRREWLHGDASAERLEERFALDRLIEILEECGEAIRDWAGLFGPWRARRPSCVAQHRDYRTACRHAFRMLFAMGMASAICFITQWPSGSQLLLFVAVVCSLLSLQDYAPSMGLAFVKSTIFCATMAYVNVFWLFQRAEGFGVLALSLGLFLVPAAYAYRHPRLHGAAVVSMLIFYGLSMPANQMSYDVVAFLNNGMALLAAALCGFFAFHAVPALTPAERQDALLGAVLGDVARANLGSGFLSEQRWTARVFDRLRLMHAAAKLLPESREVGVREQKALIGLQLGLRQIRLRELLDVKEISHEMAEEIKMVFRAFRRPKWHPEHASRTLNATCDRLHTRFLISSRTQEGELRALAELREVLRLFKRAESIAT